VHRIKQNKLPPANTIMYINLMGDLMDDLLLIGDGKMVIEMISDQVSKLIRDQFDWPSNVHGKTFHY